jgi:hypothetical protein
LSGPESKRQRKARPLTDQLIEMKSTLHFWQDVQAFNSAFAGRTVGGRRGQNAASRGK